MAEYCATIANNGTRRSAALLKEVRSYDYSKVLYQRVSEVLSRVDVDQGVFDAIHYGMWGVIYDAASTLTDGWLDSNIIVGAKTGTAQRGEGLVNNAMFILYAPYENPEIAMAIAVEKGGAGATLSPVARQVVDYYFDFHSNINTVENDYTLLK
jgi:penicillin-binding protein 2